MTFYAEYMAGLIPDDKVEEVLDGLVDDWHETLDWLEGHAVGTPADWPDLWVFVGMPLDVYERWVWTGELPEREGNSPNKPDPTVV